MKRSKKLLPVVGVAKRATEAALVKLGEANLLWTRDKQQLDDLHRYKAEYLARLRQSDQVMMSAQKVLELRGFLAQLDQAIHAQEQQVNASRKRLQYHQNIWQQARSKEQAMHSLVSRYHHEEMQVELKQEQQDNDERNTAQWLRKSR